ncbi:hypothetical protein Goarm_020035 [Gossypium armourianum]|uniref:Uncharacterized protein n=1 Tax=Gossypium armourianum TaxID=34283 RepID=A0A7J9IMF6_9ROSI|nr:hypothetical protein [Gossypium armourianum]
MSYADSEIISCIPLEVLENQEWNVNVALVVYATVSIGKPYLLPPEARSRQIQSKRQRRSPQQCRKGRGCPTGSSSAPLEDALPMAT